MLTRTGAKLLDFGLAKMRPLAAAAEHTMTMPITLQTSIVGTFPYMSPEQLEGRDADPRSDIFAFGTTLSEALAGKRAFEGPRTRPLSTQRRDTSSTCAAAPSWRVASIPRPRNCGAKRSPL